MRGDEVLLARRAHAPWRAAWSTPGGFVEAGEHPIDAARREVREELGLEVRIEAYLGVWVDIYGDAEAEADADSAPGAGPAREPRAGERQPHEPTEFINVGYYLAALSGPGDLARLAVDPAEVSDVAWFPLGSLPEPLAPPGTLSAVLAVVRRIVDGDIPAGPISDRPE